MVFEGCEELLKQSDPSLIPVGFFAHLVRSARVNWSQRGVPRLPSTANWKLPMGRPLQRQGVCPEVPSITPR